MVDRKSKSTVIANWKMNPQSRKEALALFNGVKKTAAELRHVQTVICPPFVYLTDLKTAYRGTKIHIGAQNAHFEKKGSHTGEVSPTQLSDLGVSYVILGHSERRAAGETDEEIHKKLKAALKANQTVILCLGERERDGHGDYLTFVTHQLTQALAKVPVKDLKKIIIAYEPIWAIGKTDEDAITPQKLHEMVLFIRKILVDIYSKQAALSAHIIYGGSVEPDNAEELLHEGNVEGFLVGHASLEATSFNDILTIAEKYSA